MYKATVTVYLKGGTRHSYEIEAETEALLGAKAREHSAAIMLTGFRANSGENEMTWYGPHWTDKIVIKGTVYTIYPTESTGT